MPKYKIYLYDYLSGDEITSLIIKNIQIFTSKKSMCEYHVKEYFNCVKSDIDKEYMGCWYCDFEFIQPEFWDSEDIDNDGYNDKYICENNDGDKICKRCNRKLIDFNEYEKSRYDDLVKYYEENGINEKYIYTDERELEFSD